MIEANINNVKKFFHLLYVKYIKISTYEIALISILLALFCVIKYVTSLVLKGPLNFSIEIIFWIIIGILFGPIKGPIFSLVCDTIFTFYTGIIYWMIEYAIIAPLISLFSWFFYVHYQEKNKKTIILAISIPFLLVVMSIILFSFQALNQFNYENVENIIPMIAYFLIIFLNLCIISFTLFCWIKFKKTNEWKYIMWLYFFSLIVTVIIIFRWIWGPFAFIAYLKRFFPKNIDFWKQYWLTLSGIFLKSCIAIPIATSITIPLIYTINSINKHNLKNNRFY